MHVLESKSILRDSIVGVGLRESTGGGCCVRGDEYVKELLLFCELLREIKAYPG